MKQFIANHLKNISGKNFKRKLLAFAIDDYGNIRLHSKTAKENLIKSGVKLNGRFDHLDALDTREDYEMLFEALGSVKDQNGKPAIFTPYALPCNTDYASTIANGTFIPEDLDVTYENLSTEDNAFLGAYKMLRQGIEEEFIKPQFHGREHLNVHLFNALLRDDSPELLANLKNRSLAGVPNHKDYPKVGFNQAYAFWKEEETELHKEILRDGLDKFEKVYGYRSLTFTPPAQQLHSDLYGFVGKLGVIGVDKVRATMRHTGEGNYVKEKNTLGDKGLGNTTTVVRNCVFEPNDRDIDWVNFTFKQVEAAFFWNKPAIISSHRVNFCGHIDSENRKRGLEMLKLLLKKVVARWPDVEFVSIDKLVKIMQE